MILNKAFYKNYNSYCYLISLCSLLFSVDIPSSFFPLSFSNLFNLYSLFPFIVLSLFPRKTKLKDSFQQVDRCDNTKRIFGRMETGYHFEIYQHSLRVIKHGGHEKDSFFFHSVLCSFHCILFKLCFFLQYMGNTINKLTAKTFQFALFLAGQEQNI